MCTLKGYEALHPPPVPFVREAFTQRTFFTSGDMTVTSCGNAPPRWADCPKESRRDQRRPCYLRGCFSGSEARWDEVLSAPWV